jgi:uncharacterized small protein (DUF1192 family)
MKINKENSRLIASFTPEERHCLSSALNEVRNGFPLANFEQQIGISRQEAQQLHTEFKKQSSSQDPRLELTVRQLSALHNALIETLKELGIEEFETRVGMPFEEARRFEREVAWTVQ